MLCSWVDVKAARHVMAAAARAASDNRTVSAVSDAGEAQQQESEIQQEKQQQSVEAAVNAVSPSWLRALCDRGDYGLSGHAVYVDYETYIQCKDDSEAKYPAFDFRFDIGKLSPNTVQPNSFCPGQQYGLIKIALCVSGVASLAGFITPSQMAELKARDDTATARSCHSAEFILCKPLPESVTSVGV